MKVLTDASKTPTGHAKYTLHEQAEKYIAARANRGKSKTSGAILRSDRTVLRYQGDLGRAAEYVQEKYGVTKLKNITHEQAQEYINLRLQENIRVRTVQGYAKALELLPLVTELTVPSRSSDAQDKASGRRAYTQEQFKEIQQRLLNPAAKLAVQVILESGCRTQDLASLRFTADRPLQNARLNRLHTDRFAGREEWVKVTFIGKGGHEYMSSVSAQTAEALRDFSLLAPRDFRERDQENVVTQQYYDLPVGKQLSQLWTQASKRTFGFSRGIHGLRHAFAQERVRELQEHGMTWQKALECASQLMGHYRAEQISTYLR